MNTPRDSVLFHDVQMTFTATVPRWAGTPPHWHRSEAGILDLFFRSALVITTLDIEVLAPVEKVLDKPSRHLSV